uniref:Secreted protein n=1 Tax=Oryza meridionalis TaxID=40149 RepID=A0A0E0F4R3_9ORYZ
MFIMLAMLGALVNSTIAMQIQKGKPTTLSSEQRRDISTKQGEEIKQEKKEAYATIITSPWMKMDALTPPCFLVSTGLPLQSTSPDELPINHLSLSLSLNSETILAT